MVCGMGMSRGKEAVVSIVSIGFSALDLAALGFFALCWFSYHFAVESERFGGKSLNHVMNARRRAWFVQAAMRDNRIVDTQVMNGLQNGTAFFASTSLIAVGGTMALLQSTEALLQIFTDIPFVGPTGRAALELKIIGLAVIFAYAFFKFSWSYRMFNYSAILLGALPERRRHDAQQGEVMSAELKQAMGEAARMNIVAGRHFNRGQRAFFFAIAYLGWFLGPLLFMAATAGVLVVMWNRQFRSDASRVFGSV
jgi:uncharacterized membrane protein